MAWPPSSSLSRKMKTRARCSSRQCCSFDVLESRSVVHRKKYQISASLETSACGWVGVFRADKEWKRLVYRKTISLFVLSYYPSLFFGRKVHVGEPAAAEFLVKKTRLFHRRKKRCVLPRTKKKTPKHAFWRKKGEHDDMGRRFNSK